MVVEELIAKLGFKTEGLGDLKKFENGLKNARKEVSGFGTGLRKWLGNAGSGIATKATAALSAGAAAATKFGKALMSTVAQTALMAAGIAGAIGLITKLALAFARARGEAAKLRREQQIAAEGAGSKIGSVESLQKGLDALSSGTMPGKAMELTKGLGDKVREAITSGDYSKFKEAGVKPLDERGNRRDTGAVLLELLRKQADMWSKANIAKLGASTERMKGNDKKADKLEAEKNATQVAARKFADQWGLAELEPLFKDFRGGAKALQEILNQANRDNPGRTSQQEADDARRAAQWQDLENKIKGITTAFENVVEGIKNAIFDRLINPLTEAAKAVIAFLKERGIMPETAEEKEAKASTKAAIEKDSPEVAAAKKKADKLPKADAVDFVQWLLGIGAEIDKAKGRVADARQEYETRKGEAAARVGKNLKPEMTGIKELQDAAQKFIDAVQHLESIMSKDKGAEKGAKDAGKKAENNYDQRKYSDIGNDQRTQTANVTVNATGLDAVAAKVKAAVLGAMSTKSASTSTAALTSS